MTDEQKRAMEDHCELILDVSIYLSIWNIGPGSLKMRLCDYFSVQMYYFM